MESLIVNPKIIKTLITEDLNTSEHLPTDILRWPIMRLEINLQEAKSWSINVVVSPQDNIHFRSVSRHFRDGLPVSTITLQQKKEWYLIIWQLQFNHFHQNLESKEEEKSFLERPDLFKVIQKNQMDKLLVVVA